MNGDSGEQQFALARWAQVGESAGRPSSGAGRRSAFERINMAQADGGSIRKAGEILRARARESGAKWKRAHMFGPRAAARNPQPPQDPSARRAASARADRDLLAPRRAIPPRREVRAGRRPAPRARLVEAPERGPPARPAHSSCQIVRVSFAHIATGLRAAAC